MKTLNLTLALAVLCGHCAFAQMKTSLTLERTIVLSGVAGKFDHFAIDEKGDRLFAAAEGSHSVAVIDLTAGKVTQSLPGFTKPHGLVWVPATHRLYVSDGARAELRVYAGTPLALTGTLKLSDDADDMAFDDAKHLLFIGHGGSDEANPARIAVVNTDYFTLVANLAVDTHPEALDIDPQSGRVFANIADSNEVAVIADDGRSVTARWRLTKAADNVPLAFDNEHRLIYVACRTPGTLIALDAATGKEVASQPAAGKADDLFYDAAQRRIYLISGTGEVDIYQVEETRSLRPLDVLHTAVGAKTALFVPSQRLLYVGIPGTAESSAEIRVYSTK